MEIRVTEARLQKLRADKDRLDETFKSWIAVFAEGGFFTADLLENTGSTDRIGQYRGGRDSCL